MVSAGADSNRPTLADVLIFLDYRKFLFKNVIKGPITDPGNPYGH